MYPAFVRAGLAASLLSLAIVSGCTGDAGPAGPAGSDGADGPQGLPGATGTSGPSLLRSRRNPPDSMVVWRQRNFEVGVSIVLPSLKLSKKFVLPTTDRKLTEKSYVGRSSASGDSIGVAGGQNGPVHSGCSSPQKLFGGYSAAVLRSATVDMS